MNSIRSLTNNEATTVIQNLPPRQSWVPDRCAGSSQTNMLHPQTPPCGMLSDSAHKVSITLVTKADKDTATRKCVDPSPDEHRCKRCCWDASELNSRTHHTAICYSDAACIPEMAGCFSIQKSASVTSQKSEASHMIILRDAESLFFFFFQNPTFHHDKSPEETRNRRSASPNIKGYHNSMLTGGQD